MFAQIRSLGLMGIDAYPVLVEADFHRALPAFDIVGLPDASVKESRDRVKAAMGNSGMELPTGKIVVNLAPADVRKAGALYDLPILIALLCATGQLSAFPEGFALLGELSLSGEVRGLQGILPMVLRAKADGLRGVFIPADNAAEGAVVRGIDVYPVASVSQLLAHLNGFDMLKPAQSVPFEDIEAAACADFSDVRGQIMARRAAEIAAAGGHNLLLIGAPGAGKSMIAKRFPSILPPLSFEESIETTKIHSVAGMLLPGVPLVKTRPFRAPHHTVSPAGLSGGGSLPRPGEISLAHNGVLFLDELPEFSRVAMEVLRQPIEDGEVAISRANARIAYPSRIMLIAAMNPCPCGYYGHPTRPCVCTPNRVSAYMGKVSGPLLDRIDLHIEVNPIEFEQLAGKETAESSADIRARVMRARNRQQERFAQTGALCNAQLSPSVLNETCVLTENARVILRHAFDTMGLSARAYDRILKVAKTIADLDESALIERNHIAEAVQYRSLDRKYWQPRQT